MVGKYKPDSLASLQADPLPQEFCKGRSVFVIREKIRKGISERVDRNLLERG